MMDSEEMPAGKTPDSEIPAARISGDESPAPRQPAGSPGEGEPVFLVIGKLRRPHGIQGEILMDVLTDFPERLKKGVIIYMGDQYQPLKIRSSRWQNKAMLLAFDGFMDPETAGQLRNELLYVRADDRPPLPEGEYYHHQLLGLEVVDETGGPLGVLTKILDTGANDVYVVRPARGQEILLPAIDQVILDIDLERKQMKVHILPGLIPD
jgi:16S rRNA processing protein RimM